MRILGSATKRFGVVTRDFISNYCIATRSRQFSHSLHSRTILQVSLSEYQINHRLRLATPLLSTGLDTSNFIVGCRKPTTRYWHKPGIESSLDTDISVPQHSGIVQDRASLCLPRNGRNKMSHRRDQAPCVDLTSDDDDDVIGDALVTNQVAFRGRHHGGLAPNDHMAHPWPARDIITDNTPILLEDDEPHQEIGGNPTHLGMEWEEMQNRKREAKGKQREQSLGVECDNTWPRSTSVATAETGDEEQVILLSKDSRGASGPDTEELLSISRPHVPHIDITLSDSDFDTDAEEAEDLRRAIALSLGGQDPADLSVAVATSEERECANSKEKGSRFISLESTPEANSVSTKPIVTQSSKISTQIMPPKGNDSEKTFSASSEPKSDQPTSRSMSMSTPSAVTPSTFNMKTLDRQQMEAERLARLKRKREAEQDEGSDKTRGRDITRHRELSKTVSISPPPLRRKTGTGSESSVGLASVRRTGGGMSPAGISIRQPLSMLTLTIAEPHSEAAKIPTSTATAQKKPAATSVPSRPPRPASSSSSPETLYHASGKVLQTYIEGVSPTNTISFPQLIGPKDSITSCLLSSFIWDFDWLFPHFATTRTKFQLVMHAKLPAQRNALKEDFRGVNNVRLCFPPMDGIVNCMHSKLMLLFYDAQDMDMAFAMSMPARTSKNSSTVWQGPRCRIAVPTANLTGIDWGVGGIMENTVFVIDLPVKGQGVEETSSTTGLGNETQFQKSLVAFLRAQTVPDDVIAKLENFDFRCTSHLGFVHTIGGMHGEQRWRTTGLCGLGRTVTELGLATAGSIQVDYVASSIGSLNDELMSAIYLAAQGDDGMTEYKHRMTGKAKNQQSMVLSMAGRNGLGNMVAGPTEDWRKNFRFYFPSETTVKASRGGTANAGTICMGKWWEGPKFPRKNMRDCVSVRDSCLMHNKVSNRSLRMAEN